jgi:CRISPR-associated protein Csd2
MSTTTTSTVIANRHDFVLLFDVQDGNPNGDPDMDNMPRFDPETYQGLVSDVSIKRKIRDYVSARMSLGGAVTPGYDIYVQSGHSLESRQKLPYENLSGLSAKGSRDDSTAANIDRARQWMCEHFFDVRAFGAVMSTKKFNCGQVRGPVQVTFARSVDRVLHTQYGITRVAYTTEEKTVELSSKGANTEMGSKQAIAYGLYRAHGFVSPHLASGPSGTGFTESDLVLLWEALTNMFDLDRSASRGMMSCRGLFVFRHDSPLGNAPAAGLFERIQLQKTTDTPRRFGDYALTVDEAALPAGVTLRRVV